jgi:hypothetical protein
MVEAVVAAVGDGRATERNHEYHEQRGSCEESPPTSLAEYLVHVGTYDCPLHVDCD